MQLAKPPLRPFPLGRGQLPRSLAFQVRAGARQSPSKASKNVSTSREERIVETVEVAALTAAAATVGLAISKSHAHGPVAHDQTPQRRTAAATGTGAAPLAPQNNLDTLWITGPIFIAVAARSIAARLARRRTEATPAALAMSRLAAAETALTKQSESLSVLTRQVDKVQIRTRLLSRDLRAQVKDIQASTENHSEVLLGAGAKLTQIENEVRGLEELVDAVQGIAAKQFRLISSVIGQPKNKVSVGGSTSKKSRPSSVEKNSAAKAKVDSTPLAAKQHQKQEEVTQSGNGKDEWGRAVTAAQSVQKKEKEVEQQQTSGSGNFGAMAVEEAGASSADGDKQMKINDDGSVSFSF